MANPLTQQYGEIGVRRALGERLNHSLGSEQLRSWKKRNSGGGTMGKRQSKQNRESQSSPEHNSGIWNLLHVDSYLEDLLGSRILFFIHPSESFKPNISLAVI